MDASTGPRCDRCCAAAKHLYIRGDQDWQWCNHHAREYHATLMASGFVHYELAVPDVLPVGTVPSLAEECCA